MLKLFVTPSSENVLLEYLIRTTAYQIMTIFSRSYFDNDSINLKGKFSSGTEFLIIFKPLVDCMIIQIKV